MSIILQSENPYNFLLQKLFSHPDGLYHQKLKLSVWLYLYCLANCHPKTGSLTIKIEAIANDMHIGKETIQCWLGQVRKAGLISVRKYGSVRLIRLTHWPVKDGVHFEKSQTTESTKPKQATQRSKTNKRDVESQRVESTVTPAQLAEALNAPDQINLFEKLCSDYPHHLINKSLREAQAVPAENIKKSRIALFVFLIKKYANRQEK